MNSDDNSENNNLSSINKIILNSVKLLSMKGDEVMQKLKHVNEELLCVMQLEKEIKEHELAIQTKKNKGVQYQQVISDNTTNKNLLEKYLLKLYDKEKDLNKHIEGIHHKQSELFMKEYILDQLLREHNDADCREEGNESGNNEEHKTELNTSKKRMISDTARNDCGDESGSSKENKNEHYNYQTSNNNLCLLNNNSFTDYHNHKDKHITNGNKTHLQEPPYEMKPQIICDGDELTNKNDIGELHSANSQEIKSNEKQTQMIPSHFLSKYNDYNDCNNNNNICINNVVVSEINHEVRNCKNELSKSQHDKRKKSFIIKSKLTLPKNQHNNLTAATTTTVSPTKQSNTCTNNKACLNHNVSKKHSFNISVSLSQKQFNLLQHQNTRNTSIVMETKNAMCQNNNNSNNVRSFSPSLSHHSRNKHTPSNLFTSPLTSKTNSTTVYINPALIKTTLVSKVKNEVFKHSPHKYAKQPFISLHKNSNYSRIIPYYNPSHLQSSRLISHFNCAAAKQCNRVSTRSVISKSDNCSIEKNRQHLNKATFKIKMNNFLKKLIKVFTKYKMRMYNTYIKKVVYFYDHVNVIRQEISRNNIRRKRYMIYTMFNSMNIYSRVSKLLKEWLEKSALLYNKKVSKVSKRKGGDKEKSVRKTTSDKSNSKDKIIARMKDNEERRRELQRMRKRQEDKKRRKLEKEKQRIQEEERQLRVKHEIIQELKEKLNNNKKIIDTQSLNDKQEFVEPQVKMTGINDLSHQQEDAKFNTEFVDNELNEIDKLEEELKQSATVQSPRKMPFEQKANSFSIEQCASCSPEGKQTKHMNEANAQISILSNQLLRINTDRDLISNENDNDDISTFQKELSILQEMSSENKRLEESMKKILSKLNTVPSNSQQ